jgi:hypothetical protein
MATVNVNDVVVKCTLIECTCVNEEKMTKTPSFSERSRSGWISNELVH